MFSLRHLRGAAPREISPPRFLPSIKITRKYASTTNDPPRVIFSGIQPTGIPHLGNYLGALRQWVTLQNSSPPKTTLLFSIVDLHAITLKQPPELLSQWRTEMLASLLAIGLDPKRCILFAQSSVRQHAELMWILSCGASMGYLGRMTQWKSKLSLPADASPLDASTSSRATTGASKDALKLGLFSYPVLQAADILLYNTTHVPVGEDQAQHLEFTRELAAGFNHLYSSIDSQHHSQPLLTIPQTLLSPAKRVMSLTDPAKKMSKSDPRDKSRILITDSQEVLSSKVKSALTDSIEGITYDRDTRPGVSNLIDLLYHFEPGGAESPEELARELEGISMKALKERVAEVVDGGLEEIRERYRSLMRGDRRELVEVAEEGAKRAERTAEETMGRVRRAMGMMW